MLIDRFLNNAVEVDVDALCDGSDVYIGGIMEHIEEAGIHSGDSPVRHRICLTRSSAETADQRFIASMLLD